MRTENPTPSQTLQQLANAGLKPPHTFTMAVTNRCNLRCRHCWPASGPDEQAPQIPKDRALNLMTAFSALGAEKLIITGGEPLLHPDWLDLLTHACEQSDFAEVRLQTNAILLTSEIASKLFPLLDTRLMIQTSLEGSSAHHHDRVRGEGSFDQTMLALRRLVDGGMAHRICITFTEMRHNFDDIPDLLRIVDDLGIEQFVTGTLVCDGRAVTSDDLAPPEPEQYENLIDRYRKDSAFRDRYRRMGKIAALEWGLTGAEENEPCCHLIETPYLTAEGHLYPCVMLHAKAFAAKDVHRRALTTAIVEKTDAWSQLQQFSQARPTRVEACKGCPGHKACRAGCMGRAYTAYGDFFAVEDRCQLRAAVYRKHAEK